MLSEIPADVTFKILLVDDEVNITKALRRLLSDFDHYDVHIANSGADAIEILKDEPDIGIIVSDQRMPEMTGVEFLTHARQLAPDAIRILLTGYADIEASIGAINEGAVFRYLTKPWKDDELLLVVEEAVRRYWLVTENQRLNALVAKQKTELEEWNTRLKQRVLDQTSQIRAKGDALAESHHQLRGSFAETIAALAGLIEMRDRRAPGHSRNVAELVSAMASKLGIGQEAKEKIHSAGLLHDIGKIAMSDELLLKAAEKLSGKELKEYQSHVVRGQAAIDMVPALRDIGIMIRQHHEHFDGSGFPDKLKGEAISIGARLICAADLFERQLMKFPAGEAFDAAMEALAEKWGSVLDPSLKECFEEGARDVYSHLEISAEVSEMKVSPKELAVGMQLQGDLHSGTGVLLLKKGTVFDEAAIAAVSRCFLIDPFEREISVLIRHDQEGDS